LEGATGLGGFVLHRVQDPARPECSCPAEAGSQDARERGLESYRPKLADIERQLANLKQQLEIERRIVPDEKEVDGFMRMLDAEASKAGIEIRR